jgi:adenosine deaminase
MNLEQCLFYRLNKLPEEIVHYIKEFIHLKTLLWLSKSNYMNHHYQIVKPLIYEKGCDTYMRYIVRNDFDFLFGVSLNENFIKWLKLTKYMYKNTIYSNYIYFLLYFCIEYDANKCRTVLNNVFIDKGFNKDKNKYKNTPISIIWKN